MVKSHVCSPTPPLLRSMADQSGDLLRASVRHAAEVLDCAKTCFSEAHLHSINLIREVDQFSSKRAVKMMAIAIWPARS